MPTRKPAAKATPKQEPAKPAKAKEPAAKLKEPVAKPKEPAAKPKAAPKRAKAAPPEPVPATDALVATPEPAKRPRPARKPKEVPAPEQPETAAAVPAAAPILAAEGLDPRALQVLEAIRKGCALEFIFLQGETNPPRTFEPRMLCFDALSQSWYAWGWDRRYNAERHHRLDQLQEVNLVEGLGRAAQGPFKEGTPPNQIGGWLGGEPIQVKAVLMKQWIFAVKQAPPPFPSFQLEDVEDGKAQVTFTATDLRAISRWCMQFGDGIQVLEPQRLVDRIKQVGVAWGGKPRPEPEPARAAAPQPRPAPPPPRKEREAEEKPKGKAPRVEVRIERL